MVFITKQAGWLKSARSWGALGLLLALAIVFGFSEASSQIPIPIPLPCLPGSVSPPAGMVAWWRLNEINGATVVLDSVGGNNGTPMFNNSPTTIGAGLVSVIGQYVGNSLQFGPASYVQVANASSLNFGKGAFTIDAWVRFTPGTQIYPIVNKMGPGGGYFLHIRPNNAGGHFLALQIDTALYAGPPIAFPVGTWFFVAAKRAANSGTVTLFVNNNKSTVLSSTIPNATSNGPLLIGGFAFNPHESIGIDEVEIFNVEVSDTDLMKIFNAGSKGKCK